MKRNITGNVLTLAALIFVSLSAAPTASAHEKGCSNASLKGSFSQKGTGFIIDPGSAPSPMANVGTLTFDGRGGLTGVVVNSIAGTTIQATETGTYTVNPDCTGTYTVQISPLGMTGNGYFVIDDGLNGLQIVSTDPGAVILCVGRRQFPVDSRGDD